MSKNIIEVCNLRKEFGSSAAVNDLSFAVKRGEILGLLGANGAGKTTTLYMLMGLITPTSGRIEMFGTTLAKERISILSRMNFASAYQFLPYNLKVIENLSVFAEIYCIRNAKQKMQELLETFELAHLQNKITGTLSSGEQTRLNLCKSLLNDPELLLLDEPTASLDPDLADKVRKTLLDVHRRTGMTIVNTSHNMIDVEELCDRILFMQKGRIVAEGQTHEILQKYDSKSLEEVFITIARAPIAERV
ncbi:MAG TPA: ABC transporter ATP-binding protein [Planktothrix sp.]|jgi:ABC-2 type transport system ATP-binding protein